MKHFCSECGKEVKELETFCANCGNRNFKKIETVKKRSGIGIASLVIAILSLLTCGFSSIISFILGLVGIISSKKKNKKDGLAVVGFIISLIQIVFFVGAIIFLLTAEQVETIDYSSKNYSELVEYCKDDKNKCHVEEEYSDSIPEGGFIKQEPAAGEKKYIFITDNIYYSKGQEPTTTTTTTAQTIEETTISTTKTTKSTTTKATTTKTTAVPLSGDINKTFSCPDYDVTVIGYQIKKKGTRIDRITVIGEPEWVAVFIKVQNKSNNEIDVYSHNFKFINHNGEVIEPSVLTYSIWGKYRMFKNPTLTKGGSSTGYLQYSNNDTDNNGLKFRIECGDWGIFKDETIHNLNLTN